MKMYLLSLLTLNSLAFDFNYQGEVNFEKRNFRDDKIDNTEDENHSITIIPQFEIEKDLYSGKSVLRYRDDFSDSSRDLFIIQDLWAGMDEENYILRAGYQIFDWSTLDVFNPRDVLNSKELDGNIQSLDKRGELGISVEYLFESSSLQFVYLPKFEDPIIPSATNRLGTGLIIQGPFIQESSTEETLNPWTHQVAIKYDYNFENSDLSISFLDHVDRDNPLVRFVGIGEFVPIYFRKRQYGIGVQKDWQEILFKFQGVANEYYDKKLVNTFFGSEELEDHRITAFGVEYGYELFGKHEIILYLEWQKLWGPNEEERAKINSFQNDYYLGLRYDLNDIQSTSIFLSYMSDFERSEQHLVNFNISRRLTDSWKVQLSGRYIDAPPRDKFLFAGLFEIDHPKGIENYHRDNQIFSNISYFY